MSAARVLLAILALVAWAPPAAAHDPVREAYYAVGGEVGDTSVCVWVETGGPTPTWGVSGSACGNPVQTVAVKTPSGATILVEIEIRGPHAPGPLFENIEIDPDFIAQMIWG